MSVNKRIRFEVFKRDSWTCGYCGKRPPECVLEVDHMVPVSKGGTDDVGNLITSCFDCNRGKSDHELEEKIPDSFSDAEMGRLQELLERRAVAERIAKATQEIKRGQKKTINAFRKAWDTWYVGDNAANKVPLDSNWEIAVGRFADRLPTITILEAVKIAMTQPRIKASDTWRYFCGICWRRINEVETGGAK